MDSPPVNSLGTDLVTSMKQAASRKFDFPGLTGGSQGWVSTGISRMGSHKNARDCHILLRLLDSDRMIYI